MTKLLQKDIKLLDCQFGVKEGLGTEIRSAVLKILYVIQKE